VPKSSQTHSRVAILILIVALIIVIGFSHYIRSRGKVSTDDAFVDGHIYIINSRIVGFVTVVRVEDNQYVSRGEVLVSLDPTECEVALAEAKAFLAESKFTLTSLELGVPLELTQTSKRVLGAEAELKTLNKTLETKLKEEEAAAQELKRAQAEHANSLLDLRRMSQLIRSQAISQASLDEIETKSETDLAMVGVAQARLEAARKQMVSLESDMDRLKSNIELAATGQVQAEIRAQQVAAQTSRVNLAEARVRQAELNLEYTRINSPAEGHVSRKKVEPGLMVSKGQPLMAVVPLNSKELWITANYKETQLTFVRSGQRASILVDAYPGFAIAGMVDSVMAGTGSVFSLFPPENATGNYVKIVQRIPVKIKIDGNGNENLPALRIGMSVIPTIFTGE